MRLEAGSLLSLLLPRPSYGSRRATASGRGSKEWLRLPAASWGSLRLRPCPGSWEWRTPPRTGAPEVAEPPCLPFLLNRVPGPVLAQQSGNHGRRGPESTLVSSLGARGAANAPAPPCLLAASPQGAPQKSLRGHRWSRAGRRTHTPAPWAAGRDHPTATGVRGGHGAEWRSNVPGGPG